MASEGTAMAEVGAAGTKGLKTGAVGFVSSVVAGWRPPPCLQLAVSLGLVVAAVGLASRRSMWVAFLPMPLHRHRVLLHEPGRPRLRHQLHLGDPGDGPHVGWITGWAIIVADVIVMASLAEVAAQYLFSLFGFDVFTTRSSRSRSAPRRLTLGRRGRGAVRGGPHVDLLLASRSRSARRSSCWRPS